MFGASPTAKTAPYRTRFAASLLRWTVPGQDDGWRFGQESVTSTGATAPDGRRLRFVHNWSWDEVPVRLPAVVRDVPDGTDHQAGEELRLNAWDVRVLLER
ncbi:hypothetical protein OG533_36050 [Streptomyces sp. NBC_01186]|uniref:hypothetical protein n=1 Tax=Streptomyces sp. NBC_01186 TaxID=2903765 RepID=UPI002E11EE29|nr:hypothetical protein OG533_36050 [Streptomyces sp. NBC_01186]